jgi:pyridoxine kinase
VALNKALTIAGSDSSGGAGIEADLTTFHEYGVYGMAAITTIVTMDSNWDHKVYAPPIDIVEGQIDTILGGIGGVNAAKTGMLGSSEMIEMVAGKVKQYKLSNLVVDPVMVCKGTDEPLHPEHTVSYREFLVPLATVVTPNLFEAAQLSGLDSIATLEDMKQAAIKIKESGPEYVWIKGGADIGNTAVDLLYDGKDFTLLESEKFATNYTHGAGCTSSAAICAGLAKGKDVVTAVKDAKRFISNAIRESFPINQFVGPVNRYANRKEKF